MIANVGQSRLASVIHDLPADHPGFSDVAYRTRRAEIARVAAELAPGETPPDVHYTDDEDQVWSLVSGELAEQHERHACADYLATMARLGLPTHRVPQLREVDAAVRARTGFSIRPVPGLVPPRDFYASLGHRTFLSTQYVRHHSVPFYTPEPDIIHEIIGHAPALGSPRMAPLYEAAGQASERTVGDEAHEFLSKVFWFSLEFGLVEERGELRAYGAGLLSSFGELQEFQSASVRPWDVVAMGTTPYDITTYQPVLFSAPSFEFLTEELGSFFAAYGDDWYGEHVA